MSLNIKPIVVCLLSTLYTQKSNICVLLCIILYLYTSSRVLRKWYPIQFLNKNITIDAGAINLQNVYICKTARRYL